MIDEKTYRRRLTQGMTPNERLEVFRRVGLKENLSEVMRRTKMTPEQAIFATKKERKR
jgi:hypothetical protein